MLAWRGAYIDHSNTTFAPDNVAPLFQATVYAQDPDDEPVRHQLRGWEPHVCGGTSGCDQMPAEKVPLRWYSGERYSEPACGLATGILMLATCLGKGIESMREWGWIGYSCASRWDATGVGLDVMGGVLSASCRRVIPNTHETG